MDGMPTGNQSAGHATALDIAASQVLLRLFS
jgi:hypothetical protein